MITYAPLSPSDAAALVARLRETHRSGRTKPIAWRREQLNRLRALLTDNRDAIADALWADLRKSPQEVDSAEIGLTVMEIDDYLQHLEQWLAPQPVEVAVPFLPAGVTARTEFDPLGVTLIMSAWNYPIYLLLTPVAGALASGNAVAIKPSELAPQTSALVARLVPAYLDADAVAVIEGGVEQTTSLLAQRFDHIFYTGNGTVGRIVMRAAAEHLTPVTLELGGKSPVFVDRDVDLGPVAARIASTKFANAGQTCIAPDYILTDAQTAPALAAAIAAEIEKLYGANPQSAANYGRIVNQRHFERLAGLLGSGRTVAGGQSDSAEKYIAPTVLLDVRPDAPVMQQEIFGPILPILTVADLGEAIAFINERDKPLAVYAFTGNETTRARLITETSSGAVNFGLPIYHLTVPTLPFGGVGESGMGSYHGKYSLEAFSHRKAVFDAPLN
ncbi:aldehyde dehydrogenase family protein [Janthinobacterium agaricidamnosum]|uniref:Aldehyde dehydrogenase n=1 Tax=Janthinobacterium agaricidamnosum NBRC 102515 = DSM 9628 TaxID=1349767 RepID=W0V6W7_9BURK|nr:aldehyde dehydrogenase family protein [Janthinobacterium agaricidamnosum]CDG82997.1 fatty aldehyde dehydrogenase [Janthinobacterium agaricidamnosum NBRC 102515 = DSM 9628]